MPPGQQDQSNNQSSKDKEADFGIIAVPTPVTKAKDPDLGAGYLFS